MEISRYWVEVERQHFFMCDSNFVLTRMRACVCVCVCKWMSNTRRVINIVTKKQAKAGSCYHKYPSKSLQTLFVATKTMCSFINLRSIPKKCETNVWGVFGAPLKGKQLCLITIWGERIGYTISYRIQSITLTIWLDIVCFIRIWIIRHCRQKLCFQFVLCVHQTNY